jgi:hypothetical protein
VATFIRIPIFTFNAVHPEIKKTGTSTGHITFPNLDNTTAVVLIVRNLPFPGKVICSNR